MEAYKKLTEAIETRTGEIIDLSRLVFEFEPSVKPLTKAIRALLDEVDNPQTPESTSRKSTSPRKFFRLELFIEYVMEYFKPYIRPLSIRLLASPPEVGSVQSLVFVIDSADECAMFQAVYKTLLKLDYELVIEAL